MRSIGNRHRIPDVSVTLTEPETDVLQEPAFIAIEILSKKATAADLLEKLPEYVYPPHRRPAGDHRRHHRDHRRCGPPNPRRDLPGLTAAPASFRSNAASFLWDAVHLQAGS